MTDIKNWISTNIRGGDKIDEHTYQSIADFCVMWALFEGTELHDIDVAVDELKTIAHRVEGNIQDFEVPLEFWKNRYVQDNEINSKFEYLNFSHQPHKRILGSGLSVTHNAFVLD